MLDPLHLVELHRSGLSDDAIARSRIHSADADTAAALVGIPCGSAMVIPYPDARLGNGSPFCRVKPDAPKPDRNGKTAKYLSPTRALNPEGNRLYFPPNLDSDVLADASTPILITEGEKKALKATQEGVPCLGLAGVYAWKKRDEDDQSQPIADLYKVQWRGRLVGIVFDSDAAFNDLVKAAEKALRDELRRRGARVYIIRLPEPTFEEAKVYGSKLGLDDFLCARGADAFGELMVASAETLPLGAKSARVLMAEADPEEPELIQGLWPEAGCGFFAGEPKTKKSFLSLALAYCVATGTPFLGRAVRKGTVVIVDEENDRRELKKRMRRVAAGLGVPADLDAIIVAAPSVLKLDNPDAMKELRALLDEVKPALVVLDPLVRLHQGDENEAMTVAPMLADVRRASRHFRCSVIVVHHLRKKAEGTKASHGQRMRGSSDLHGWLDAAVYFEKGSDDLIKLTFETRYCVPPDPMYVQLTDGADSVRWERVEKSDEAGEEAEPLGAIRRVLEVAEVPITREELRIATGLSDKRLKAGITSLVAANLALIGSRPTGGKPATTFWLRSRGAPATYSPSGSPLEGGTTAKKSDASPADPSEAGELLRRPSPPKDDRGDEEGVPPADATADEAMGGDP